MCCMWLAGNVGPKNSPSGHYRTTLSGYIFTTKACIDNRKKNLLNSNTSSTCPYNMVSLRPTSGWNLLSSLGHPCKFQRVLHLGSVTARHSSSGRQPNFAALNRGRHLYSAGRPSRWTLAYISSWPCFLELLQIVLPSEVSEHWRCNCRVHSCVAWRVLS